MELKYETYPFTPILGWSISRYELFSKCKRQYFYSYYPKHVPEIPLYKIKQLKDLTSIPLECGNIVHDIIETFLFRLQKSASDINEERFYSFAEQKLHDYFSRKTFIESYYGAIEKVTPEMGLAKTLSCLRNFISSPCYNWIFMKGLINKSNWMIEPAGYGETRLDGMKAYCKMDFLFPVDGDIYILDWKTGHKDTYKHTQQLIGYAAAASSNFKIDWKKILPKIVYLFPQFDEFELTLKDGDLSSFFDRVKMQTQEMYRYCRDVENNVPIPIDEFVDTASPEICRNCNFQELCLPKKKAEGTPFGQC